MRLTCHGRHSCPPRGVRTPRAVRSSASCWRAEVDFPGLSDSSAAPYGRPAWPDPWRRSAEPSPHDLQYHSAHLSRLGVGHPVVDCGQGKQATRLGCVVCPSRCGAQLSRTKFSPERDGHGKPPLSAMLNQPAASKEILLESHPRGLSITFATAQHSTTYRCLFAACSSH